MEKIVSFLIENWQPVSGLLLALLGLLLTLFKKKPKAYSFMDYADAIVSKIPELINEVEKPGCGSSKKELVISRCLAKLKLCCSCSERELELAKKFFDKAIEDILSTPHKKG